MAVKATMIFSLKTAAASPAATPSRTAGWSESWYQTGTDINAARTLMTASTPQSPTPLANARASLLPNEASIVGIRYQVVDPVGKSLVQAITLPGGISSQFNTQGQTALLCNAFAVGGLKNIKRFVLRCLPVSSVLEGEYVSSVPFAPNFVTFINTLGNWFFRGRDLGQTANPVLTITAAGLVSGVPALPYAPLQMVRVLRSRDTSGRLRGGRFQVASIGPGANQVTLANWPWGATTGGTIRLDGVIYPQVDPGPSGYVKLTTRKVGRPFFLFRGRRTAKH